MTEDVGKQIKELTKRIDGLKGTIQTIKDLPSEEFGGESRLTGIKNDLKEKENELETLKIKQITDMGFPSKSIKSVLNKNDGNVQATIQELTNRKTDSSSDVAEEDSPSDVKKDPKKKVVFFDLDHTLIVHSSTINKGNLEEISESVKDLNKDDVSILSKSIKDDRDGAKQRVFHTIPAIVRLLETLKKENIDIFIVSSGQNEEAFEWLLSLANRPDGNAFDMSDITETTWNRSGPKGGNTKKQYIEEQIKNRPYLAKNAVFVDDTPGEIVNVGLIKDINVVQVEGTIITHMEESDGAGGSVNFEEPSKLLREDDIKNIKSKLGLSGLPGDIPEDEGQYEEQSNIEQLESELQKKKLELQQKQLQEQQQQEHIKAQKELIEKLKSTQALPSLPKHLSGVVPEDEARKLFAAQLSLHPPPPMPPPSVMQSPGVAIGEEEPLMVYISGPPIKKIHLADGWLLSIPIIEGQLIMDIEYFEKIDGSSRVENVGQISPKARGWYEYMLLMRQKYKVNRGLIDPNPQLDDMIQAKRLSLTSTPIVQAIGEEPSSDIGPEPEPEPEGMDDLESQLAGLSPRELKKILFIKEMVPEYTSNKAKILLEKHNWEVDKAVSDATGSSGGGRRIRRRNNKRKTKRRIKRKTRKGNKKLSSKRRTSKRRTSKRRTSKRRTRKRSSKRQ